MTEKVQSNGQTMTHRQIHVSKLFCMYRFTTRLYFFLPFLVLIFLERGVGYAQIGILLSLFSLAALFAGGPIQRFLTGKPVLTVMLVRDYRERETHAFNG
jgi:hypothetical protein